jgi:hypothetical protein
MNYFKLNIKIIAMLFLIITSIVLLFLTSINENKESFTSGFREMYRPYIRNVRLIGGNYYTKVKNNTQLIFRKFGLI